MAAFMFSLVTTAIQIFDLIINLFNDTNKLKIKLLFNVKKTCSGNVDNWKADLLSGMDYVNSESVDCITALKDKFELREKSPLIKTLITQYHRGISGKLELPLYGYT